ncbi:MAG: phytanoyl-CoA dioxygenase family protein [Pseudomonadota bacterium]
MTEVFGAEQNRFLTGDNATRTDVNQAWEQDNQAWWDWYVSLADNQDGEVTLQDLPPTPAIAEPDDATLMAELAEPYPLTDDDVAFFQANAFIKLKNVLSPGAAVRLRRELVRMLKAEFDSDLDGAISERFLSMDMMWTTDPIIRAYVLSPRISKICADLLKVPRLRLYHDNILSKEPACGRTPWHFDDHHFPLASHDVVTAWIPAQAIPLVMGPLAFAAGMDTYKLIEGVDFNKFDTSYDRTVAEIFRQSGVRVDESSFEIGEVSFHHNLSFHTAARNRTTQSRIVLANTFYADGARVLDQPTMVSGDWLKFIPGAEPGGLAQSDMNPVVWPPEAGFGDPQ